MKRLRFLTAGESHGPALLGILEGLPAGLPLSAEQIDRDLRRRQQGYGRGGRMKIERDRVEILAGVRFGRTLGSPLALQVANLDHENWTERMRTAPGGPDPAAVTVPRPGHADLAGALKYGHTADLRNVLERASARETTMRVALGAAARVLLRNLGIAVGSYVRSIGGIEAISASEVQPELYRHDAEELGLLADRSEVRALDADSTAQLVARIDDARRNRETLGGVIEVIATGVPPGLGSHVQWDRRLDGRLARALLSIPAIKAVEIGDGWAAAALRGSQVHDPIHLVADQLRRGSNHAGGLEGGITNGEPLVIRAAMKPIATLPAALPSVDLRTLQPRHAHVERSDTCAVPAAGVVAEAMVALTLADALLEALGGDTMQSLRLPFAKLRIATRARLGHIFLLGPMGSGKTSAGLILAHRLGRPFVDLDAQIEARANTSVAEIFRSAGEEEFRRLEALALEEACDQAPAVVALGGGAVIGERAWRRMREVGVTVRLHAPPWELARRLTASGRKLVEARPLLAGSEDPAERLRQLLEEREDWYARADLHLDTTSLTAEETAGAIVGLLRTIEGPLAPLAGGAGRGGPTAPEP